MILASYICTLQPNMKSFILLFAFLTLSSKIFAQEFDLNSYKFRYQKYKGLLGDFSLSDQGGKISNQFRDSSNTSKYDYEQSGNSLNFNISPSYFSFTNLDKIQKTFSVGLTNQFRYSTGNSLQNNQNGSSTNIYNEADLNIESKNRYYYGSKFDLLNISSQLNRTSNKLTIDNSPSYTQLTDELSTSLTWDVKIGKGKGRLEYVSDAVSAMFLLKDLEKELGVSYSNEQISKIANSITQIRNQRYLDTRLGTKSQLKLLDTALIEYSLNVHHSIDYFAILNDNWLYAQQAMRTSGKRWTYFMENYGNFDRNYSSNISSFSADTNQYDLSRRKSRSLNHDIGIDLDYSKQLSLYHEISFGGSISTGIESTVSGSKVKFDSTPVTISNNFLTFSNIYWHSAFRCYWQHLYQPNTRNILIARLTTEVSYNRQLAYRDEISYSVYDNDVLPLVNASLSYYKWISPHFNFNINVSTTYSNSSNYTTTKQNEIVQNYTRLNYNAQAGFTYQLF